MSFFVKYQTFQTMISMEVWDISFWKIQLDLFGWSKFQDVIKKKPSWHMKCVSDVFILAIVIQTLALKNETALVCFSVFLC